MVLRRLHRAHGAAIHEVRPVAVADLLEDLGLRLVDELTDASGERTKVQESAKMMISEAQRAIQQDPSNGAALGILAGGYALLGEEERTREWIDRALLIDPDNLNMRYNFACILSGHLGDKDGAIRMLQSTLPHARAYQISIAEYDTDFDNIRDDPRFQQLLEAAKKRVGLLSPTETSPAQPS